MSDLERDLRELLDRKARESGVPPMPEPKALRRARRRQVGTVLVSALAVTAVVAGSIVGVKAVLGPSNTSTPLNESETSTPQLPVAPEGFRAAALPFASIAYPEGWYLLDTSPLEAMGPPSQPYGPPMGTILQLTNFDPDLRLSPRCVVDPDAIPDDAVILSVMSVDPKDPTLGQPASSWPTTLAPEANVERVCAGESSSASWTTPSGLRYYAFAIFGPNASTADREALQRAYGSMVFPSTDAPQMSRFAAFQEMGTPRIVLDSATFQGNPYTLEAYLELGKTLWVGVAGPAGSFGGGAIGVGTGSGGQPASVDTTMSGWADGAVVWGTVEPEVARAEIITDEAKTFPATIVTLPDSLGRDQRVTWGFVDGPTTYAQGIGYDAEGNRLGDFPIPTAPREVIGTGEDPDGGPWELFLTHDTTGTGLSFGFRDGGSGGSCCLRPLKDGEDLRLDGTGSGGGEPSDITAIVSSRVARVAYVSSTGETFEGHLFAIPEQYIGPAQAVVILVPQGLAPDGTPRGDVSGDLIAYDVQGSELGRESVGGPPEPSGPTPEIDAVWQALYKARDAISIWGDQLPLEEVTETALSNLEPGVRWSLATALVPGSITVRDIGSTTDPATGAATGGHAVLVGATPSGDAYCVGVEIDEQGGASYSYGHLDAQTTDECRGEWS